VSTYILFGIPAAIGVFLIGMYNGLIGKKNQVANVYASLDAMLQKRYDLIPNLVATGAGLHEARARAATEIVQLRNACQYLIAQPSAGRRQNVGEPEAAFRPG
jgi:LemA protein